MATSAVLIAQVFLQVTRNASATLSSVTCLDIKLYYIFLKYILFNSTFLRPLASHLSLLWLLASSKCRTNLCIKEKLFLQSLYKVVVSVSEKKNPLIIYLRDVEKLLESEIFYKLFQILLNKISGPVLILGSRVLVTEDYIQEVGEGVSALFLYSIEIRQPEDESQLLIWKNRLEDDMKMVQFQDNKNQSIPQEPQYHCIFAGM
ncbi:hypothetical protein Bca52824_011471 [Brassica carinata]|uniref:Uncharacterized protein n=1 Tax=Brassica carinata TaxID=52824 RepID=A0A8X7WDA7_BRACI|nr:hypothetical protein Bca52824_011471 [Brassica carinata]